MLFDCIIFQVARSTRTRKNRRSSMKAPEIEDGKIHDRLVIAAGVGLILFVVVMTIRIIISLHS